MNKDILIEIIRFAYLAGIQDQEENAACWCTQGSKERAKELFIEMSVDNIIKEDFYETTSNGAD